MSPCRVLYANTAHDTLRFDYARCEKACAALKSRRKIIYIHLVNNVLSQHHLFGKPAETVLLHHGFTLKISRGDLEGTLAVAGVNKGRAGPHTRIDATKQGLKTGEGDLSGRTKTRSTVRSTPTLPQMTRVINMPWRLPLTWQWVVERGIDKREPMMIMMAAPSSMLKPREGVILAIFTPMAVMILYP